LTEEVKKHLKGCLKERQDQNFMEPGNNEKISDAEITSIAEVMVKKAAKREWKTWGIGSGA